MVGTVYLGGAGCGPADLITVRGLRLLRNCGAVVYDDLIAPELLDEVPAAAERVYMASGRGGTPPPRRKSAPSWWSWPGRERPWCG